MSVFQTFIQNLNNMGFYDFLLPWLLVFAIVYGAMRTSKIFNEVNKPVSGIVSLVVAFFVASFGGKMMASFFTNIFGGAMMVVAGILVIVIFAIMFGCKWGDCFGSKNKILPIAVILGLAIVVFFSAFGTISTGIALNSTAQAAIFVVVIIGIAFYFITSQEETKKEEGAEGAEGAGNS